MDQAAAAEERRPPKLATRMAARSTRSRRWRRTCPAQGKLASAQGDELATGPWRLRASKLLAAKLDGADAKAASRDHGQAQDKLKTAAIVLAAVDGDKVQLAAGVTADSTARVKAGELVSFVASQVGSKGGSKPGMAMAGGTDAEARCRRLASVAAWSGRTRVASSLDHAREHPPPRRMFRLEQFTSSWAIFACSTPLSTKVVVEADPVRPSPWHGKSAWSARPGLPRASLAAGSEADARGDVSDLRECVRLHGRAQAFEHRACLGQRDRRSSTTIHLAMKRKMRSWLLRTRAARWPPGSAPRRRTGGRSDR